MLHVSGERPVEAEVRESAADAEESTVKDDEPIDGSLVLDGETMVGDDLEKVEDGETGEQVEARRIRTSESPKLPTLKEIESHNMGHLVYRSWCPFCVAGRKPNAQHRRQWDQRSIPLMVGDFCYIRSSQDESSTTVFVGKVVPQNVTFAMAIDVKGATPGNVARLAKIIRDVGLTKFAYRSDQEKAVTGLIEAAAMAAQRSASPEAPAIVAAPENSSVGESASNGLAERTVQTIEDHVRTLLLALESRIKSKIPVGHPLIHWLVEHSAVLKTKYDVGPDGHTGYWHLHGRECTEKLVEFGEKVMYYIPRKLRAKLDPRWKYGVWLGRALSADESYIGTADGQVTRARGIMRLVESVRWDATRLNAVRAKPGAKAVDGIEQIEEDTYPHLGKDDKPREEEDPDVAAHKKAQMRLRITVKDLDKYGYSDNCPRCNMHLMGKTSGVNHSEACRARLYKAMREANDSKLAKAKHLGDEEVKPKPREEEPELSKRLDGDIAEDLTLKKDAPKVNVPEVNPENVAESDVNMAGPDGID